MSLEVNGQLVPVGGGDPIPLVRETLTIGRRESCDIPMRYPNVSGLHCQLSFYNGYWFIQDLGSTNGVKVNGAKIHLQKKLLHSGDEVSIAKRRFLIEYSEVAGRNTLEEIAEEEDVMGQSLLEKAGLARPKPRYEDRRENDAGEFLLQDDEETPRD
jgi:adenylate cyclase